MLNRTRIRSAYGVAIAIDVLQFVLGPLGWAGSDEMLDVIAAIVETRLLGFHPLLLPTFVLEFLPLADMLPTWTGCVVLVMRARHRQGVVVDDAPPAIDVKARKVE